MPFYYTPTVDNAIAFYRELSDLFPDLSIQIYHNPTLHRIRIPTLFLWGAHDGFAPLAYGRGYCAAVPGAKFEEIAEAGHFPHMEQPEAVARRVIEFGLAQQAARA